MNLRALSSDLRFPSSQLSNTLQVSTGNHPLHMNFVGYEEDLTAFGDSELMVKVIRVTEATVHLDWSQYTEIQGMTYYRVVWSSVAQPAVSMTLWGLGLIGLKDLCSSSLSLQEKALVFAFSEFVKTKYTEILY